MRIIDLHLEGIGPFRKEYLRFIDDENQKPPVVIITGENGTGKTIVLDAIRGLLFGRNDYIGRDIFNSKPINLWCNINYSAKKEKVKFKNFSTDEPKRFFTTSKELQNSFSSNPQNSFWITNYWNSNLRTGNFDIKSLTIPDHKNYLKGSLSGNVKNTSITELICYFDYIKTSDDPYEKRLGNFLFEKLKEIIKLCLNNGELAYVSKINLQPVIRQNGSEVTLDKLSSGNLYLVQRMVSLLGQMHAANVLNNKPLEEVCETPGLLLIDEAENHLHPKWQKTFINNILKIFPNLQIILTTHSPFIVSSVENAKIFVCKSGDGYSYIEDATGEYSNLPVEEVLISPLFDETHGFNQTITDKIIERKKAILTKDFSKREQIENELKALNPSYFSYFDVDKLLADLK